jgi:hypothetical protein
MFAPGIALSVEDEFNQDEMQHTIDEEEHHLQTV